MARILVVAGVNADRIWTLAQKLRPGARHACMGIATQIGGAGWYAANALRLSGHEVTLASVIGEDPVGEAIFRRLGALGIDTSVVRRVPKTHAYDILVDPDGERTLLFANSLAGRPLPVLPEGAGYDGAYVNAWSAISASACVRDGAPILVQLPLRDRVGRYPGTHVVVSRSDVTETPRELWSRALETTGGGAHGLVITDGPGPVVLVTGEAESSVPVGPLSASASITVGCGDTFAGHLIAHLATGAALAEATAAASRAATGWLDRRPPPAMIEI